MLGTAIVATTTISVTIGPGRFFPPAANQIYQLYQYEDISNTFGSNPVFSTVLAIDSIVTVPTLPRGLTLSGSSNTFYLLGVPLAKSAQSSYTVIGSNSTSGKIVTSTVAMQVNEQVVRISPSFYALTDLTVDALVLPITFTAIQPQLIYAYTFRYGWSDLPDGFVFKDINGNIAPTAFAPADPALTIVLTGSPTLAFATSMAASGGNLYQTRLYGTQTDQSGTQTTGTALINFSFAETVLISVSNAVQMFEYKTLGSNDVVITTGTFFATSPIVSVQAESLPPGLSLVNLGDPNTYFLRGTPSLTTLPEYYTFTATNYNGTSRSVNAYLPIYPDIVSFGGSTPADGTVVQFIIGRPLTNAKATYYTTPITFTATSAASGTPITYTSSIDVTPYGLILSSTTGALTGLPTSLLSSTTVTITATDVYGKFGTTTIQLSILDDVFTWPTYAPAFFQNRAITPYTFVMTSTLSDRAILSYSSSDLPTGLTITPSGLLSGTPTTYTATGTFHISATTGYSTYSQIYSYTMIQDNLLVLQVNGTDSIGLTFSDIPFITIQYSSDAAVTPTYSVANVHPTPAPTLTMSASGMLSGDFTGATFSSTYYADITATYAGVTGSTTITLSNGTIFTSSGNLTFTQPTLPIITLYQYVPYTIPVQATVSPTEFIYYYGLNIPLGLTFTPESTGTSATISGISPSNNTNAAVTLYAKTATGAPVARQLTLRTVIPFFVNPQSNAAAYTAILREHVDADAAQNARDNKTFPQVDALAGPFMAPRAPDVVTPNDCFLKLCRKPCPTCHTMM